MRRRGIEEGTAIGIAIVIAISAGAIGLYWFFVPAGNTCTVGSTGTSCTATSSSTFSSSFTTSSCSTVTASTYTGKSTSFQTTINCSTTTTTTTRPYCIFTWCFDIGHLGFASIASFTVLGAIAITGMGKVGPGKPADDAQGSSGEDEQDLNIRHSVPARTWPTPSLPSERNKGR